MSEAAFHSILGGVVLVLIVLVALLVRELRRDYHDDLVRRQSIADDENQGDC